MVKSILVPFWLRVIAVAAVTLSTLTPAHAGLFDDSEARRAILDLRSRTANLESQLANTQNTLLDQSNQIVQLQQQTANLRGQNEELSHQLTVLQQTVKDYYADLRNQMQKLEPKPSQNEEKKQETEAATSDEPATKANANLSKNETTAFNKALQKFRAGEFKGATADFRSFIKNYPQSTYQPTAQYWLGNALYAQRDYKASNAVLQGVVKNYSSHQHAPDALLAIAQNQLEQGQKSAAKQTWQRIIKQYPRSEADWVRLNLEKPQLKQASISLLTAVYRRTYRRWTRRSRNSNMTSLSRGASHQVGSAEIRNAEALASHSKVVREPHALHPGTRSLPGQHAGANPPMAHSSGVRRTGCGVWQCHEPPGVAPQASDECRRQMYCVGAGDGVGESLVRGNTSLPGHCSGTRDALDAALQQTSARPSSGSNPRSQAPGPR